MSNSVRLLPSKVEFKVQNGQSVLEAALSANIALEYSCSNGKCGECKAGLISGEVEEYEHTADLELNQNEILTCMSLPRTDLVLNALYYKELDGIEIKTIPVKVDSIRHVTEDIIILVFRLPPTANFQYLSGQFIDLMWKGQKRSYSLASSEVIKNKLELHIKKVENGLFSQFLFNDLRLNHLLRFHGPLGTFFIRESSAPIIFLCTGSGFAPVKSMVERLIANNSTRDIYIYWGGRFRTDLYSQIPEEWAANYQNIDFTPVYSQEVELRHGEASGYCQYEAIKQHKALEGFDVYACGSDQMIHNAKELFIEHGLIDENFHSDSFLASN